MTKTVTTIAIVISVLQFIQINNLTKKLALANSAISGLAQKLDDTMLALTDANDQIERANEMINDAKSSAWVTYDDMGSALDDLEEVDAIDVP